MYRCALNKMIKYLFRRQFCSYFPAIYFEYLKKILLSGLFWIQVIWGFLSDSSPSLPGYDHRQNTITQPSQLLCKRSTTTKRWFWTLFTGPSTRVADEGAGVRRALATLDWTSAHLPLHVHIQTCLSVWTRRPLWQQSWPSPTMFT